MELPWGGGNELRGRHAVERGVVQKPGGGHQGWGSDGMGAPIRPEPHLSQEINGPAAGDDRGPFLLLAHGLGISGPALPGRWVWGCRIDGGRAAAGTGAPAGPVRSVAAPAG